MAVFAAAAMSGCAESADAGVAPLPEPVVASSAPAPAPSPAEDADICTAYGDVLTILENADIALDDGRMEPQEHQGWHKLATRVLDRLPSSGDGPVRSAVTDLKEAAPAVPSGFGRAPEGVRSPEWYAAEEALGAACDELGTPLAISMFTGG
ncbi:hypothetical protein M3148_06035 [Georgenia satyanarayanai]|uniref:hypothetical protein n=1 Tax=Georgenia satyanarayanai TaxID=860221 RepID=UPI00204136FD|nr:hypothetical protein [Georgenia satyanarayanai]MCM3660553.1 hypothetical protein [Georgenia satyanarayanai]